MTLTTLTPHHTTSYQSTFYQPTCYVLLGYDLFAHHRVYSSPENGDDDDDDGTDTTGSTYYLTSHGLPLAEEGQGLGPGEGFGQGWLGGLGGPVEWSIPPPGMVNSDVDPSPLIGRRNRHDNDERGPRGAGLGSGQGSGPGPGRGLPTSPPSKHPCARKSIPGLVTLHLPSGAAFHAFPAMSPYTQGQGLGSGRGQGQGQVMVVGKVCNIWSSIVHTPTQSHSTIP